MVFSSFVKTSSGGQIVLKNEAPIENVGAVKFFKDNSSTGFAKKEFRWSFNKNYWSSWETLNQANFSKISPNGQQYLFLEIRYIGTGTVSSFSLTYETAGTSQQQTVVTPQPSSTPVQNTPGHYVDFVKTTSGDNIVLTNRTPIENVGDIKFYKDDSSGFSKKEFRWSFNKGYWSAWETLTQNSLSNIKVSGKPYLFLEIRYIGVGTVSKFSITYSVATQTTTGNAPEECPTLIHI